MGCVNGTIGTYQLVVSNWSSTLKPILVSYRTTLKLSQPVSDFVHLRLLISASRVNTPTIVTFRWRVPTTAQISMSLALTFTPTDERVFFCCLVDVFEAPSDMDNLCIRR